MAELSGREFNPWPKYATLVHVDGFDLHVEIKSKDVGTGAGNRLTHTTVITIANKLYGYGFRTNRRECEIMVRTHAILDYTKKPAAYAAHVEKVRSALKKIDVRLSGFVVPEFVDRTYDNIVWLSGENRQPYGR